jgi:hypothetical protein
MSLPRHSTLDELIGIYTERLNQDNKNIERIKKFYNDEESFNLLMQKLIDKDARRLEKLFDKDPVPNAWRILYIILDIVQNEGKEVPPFDTLTNMLPSRTLMYYGWTFSWVHGENTLLSIFNRENELVYRF